MKLYDFHLEMVKNFYMRTVNSLRSYKLVFLMPVPKGIASMLILTERKFFSIILVSKGITS